MNTPIRFITVKCPRCSATLKSSPGWFQRNRECRYCNADLSSRLAQIVRAAA